MTPRNGNASWKRSKQKLFHAAFLWQVPLIRPFKEGTETTSIFCDLKEHPHDIDRPLFR